MYDVNCPKCGSKMVERVAKVGLNSGKHFLGCSQYPACKIILPIETKIPQQLLTARDIPLRDSTKPNIIHHVESTQVQFEGTLVDIETIGNFDNKYERSDSRLFNRIIQVVFGFLDNEKLEILCSNGPDAIELLKKQTKDILPKLKRPLYAFNCSFERGVWCCQSAKWDTF
jgi:ssDNA-binding Zn-finger/Zn-ribbon topoisomerase 1